MDRVSYDGFQRRVLYLESLLSPSFEALPVFQQLAKLNALINNHTDSDFQHLFKLLNESNIWHRLPTLKSEVDLEIGEDYRNVVLANKERMLVFLRDFEEVIRLTELMGELMKSSSSHYETLLNTHVPVEAYNQLVDNYSKLLVRSIALLERNFKLMVRENQYWVDLEKKLSGMERAVHLILENRKSETRYT